MDEVFGTSKSRRRLPTLIGAIAAAVVLAATSTLALARPAQAGNECGAAIVNWVPDIGHPVAWGYEDLNQDSGAPRTMRIYYPSEHTPAYRAPLLQLCLGRWPVVLFLPGEVPPGLSQTDYYQLWDLFGQILARIGYVVVVPQYTADLPAANYWPAVQAALADINFVQNAWSGSDYVDGRAPVTTVGGHSNGALLAARVASANPNFGAYFSLGGRFHDLPDPFPAASAGGVPSFFMWTMGDSRESSREDLHIDKVWDNIQQNRYAIRYEGEHFDYLPTGLTGTAPVGKNQKTVGVFAADLLAHFIAKFVISHTPVQDPLYPVYVPLTVDQQVYRNHSYVGTGEFAYTYGSGGKADFEWWIFDQHGQRTN